MTSPDHGAEASVPSLDDVVRWLTLADSDEMSRLVERLYSELAEQLVGASVLSVTRTLQLAAKELCVAPVKDADKALFQQFALEVEDVLARLGARMVVRAQ